MPHDKLSGPRPSFRLSPGLAFNLAYAPANVVAIDQTRTLLDQLSKDPAVVADRELAHAVTFARKAKPIARKTAIEKVLSVITKAAAVGLAMPSPPDDVRGWLRWRSALESLVTQNVDEEGSLALSLGLYSYDLLRAWSFAANLAYLRASRENHPLLLEAARNVVGDVTNAAAALDRALVESGRPLLVASRRDLADWIKHAPAPDAVNSIGWGEGRAAADMNHWIETLDLILGSIAKELDAPSDPPAAAPPTPEEQELLAAIIANPDDDELRHRFAALAEHRGDARAEFIRDQFEILRDTTGRPFDRVRQRIILHPEWSAPLLALGARDIAFVKGFPSEITIDLETFVRNAGELFALAPITAVRIRGWVTDGGAKLASVPQLAQLHVLDISTQGVTDADVAALVQNGRLQRLWELDLRNAGITDAAIDAIAAATQAMPELTCVHLPVHIDPCDQFVYYNETQGNYVPTPRGEALEAKYGPLPWLHAEMTVLRVRVPQLRTPT